MERFLKSRYRIGEKLSENPFSVTYKGSFLATDKPLVIKIYKRGTLSSALIRSMKQKVKELSHVNYHGIAKLIDGDYGWQGFYYVREFVPGNSLKEIMEKLDQDKAIVIAEEVCKALEYAHKRNIVHGAINPNNIFVDQKGVVKIADFVIEGEIKEAFQQKAESVLSDSRYMSPEELLGYPAGKASDIYGLGLVLYEMLQHKKEVSFSKIQKIKQPSVLNSELLTSLPRYLQEIINKAMQKDPLLRFASAEEFKQSLEHKNVVTNPKTHKDYIDIFENTVTSYGAKDISIESEAIEDVGQVKLRWSKEKHRRWILLLILALAVLSGIVYAFVVVR